MYPVTRFASTDHAAELPACSKSPRALLYPCSVAIPVAEPSHRLPGPLRTARHLPGSTSAVQLFLVPMVWQQSRVTRCGIVHSLLQSHPDVSTRYCCQLLQASLERSRRVQQSILFQTHRRTRQRLHGQGHLQAHSMEAPHVFKKIFSAGTGKGLPVQAPVLKYLAALVPENCIRGKTCSLPYLEVQGLIHTLLF